MLCVLRYEKPMTHNVDNPTIQREIHAHIDRALLSRGMDFDSPIKAELLRRAEVLTGHRQALIRFRDTDQTLVSAEMCLNSLMSRKGTSNNSAGPAQIAYADREALFNVDIEKIASGEISVFDDRKHPR